MKRSITFFFLFSSSFISFSQKEITNESHPFQVLFVEEVTIFGREVKQYDYLTNSDLLNVKGSITLFHFSGEMFELGIGSYWTDELIKIKLERSHYRPLINPIEKENFEIITRGAFCRMPTPEIDLVIPTEAWKTIDIYRKNSVDLGWVLTDEEDYKLYKSFIIEFSNIYDEKIRTVEVRTNFYSFRTDTLDSNKNDTINLNDGLLIVSIHGKHNDEFTSGELGFRLHNQDEEIPAKAVDKNYSGLLDAIYYDHINDNKRANFLYLDQLKKSNQDPRFIQLYEDFLERNPEFK